MCLCALDSAPLMNTSWCYLTLGWLNQYYPSFFIEHRTFMEEQMVLYSREESVRLGRIRLCTSCNAHTHTHTHTHHPCSIEPVRLILSVKRLGLERLPRLWRWMCAWLQNEPTDFMNALMNAVKHVALGMFQDRFKPASSKSVFGCFNLTSKYQYIWKKFLLLPSF